MKTVNLWIRTLLWGALSLMVFSARAEGPIEAVWHCSRNTDTSAVHLNAESEFTTASVNGTIDVSLDDLVSAYSGYPIRIAGKPLFACFMPGQEALSAHALQSLGLSSAAMQMLARRSAIVQRNFKLVTDEGEMLRCLESHTPSFGYLSQAISNERVAPCF